MMGLGGRLSMRVHKFWRLLNLASGVQHRVFFCEFPNVWISSLLQKVRALGIVVSFVKSEVWMQLMKDILCEGRATTANGVFIALI